MALSSRRSGIGSVTAVRWEKNGGAGPSGAAPLGSAGRRFTSGRTAPGAVKVAPPAAAPAEGNKGSQGASPFLASPGGVRTRIAGLAPPRTS